MAIWKYKTLQVIDHPKNDRMSLAVVRFRRYADQAAADADPNLDADKGFQLSWDSKTDSALGHAIFGDNLDAAYIDSVAPAIIASLEGRIAGRAALENVVGTVKSAEPAAPPSPPSPAFIAFRQRWIRLARLKQLGSTVTAIVSQQQILQGQIETYLTANSGANFNDIDLL